jgi:hypothetical protein
MKKDGITAMDESERSNREATDRPAGRIIDVSGDRPVVVEEESGFPFVSSGAERIRVFTASGGPRTCAIPLIVILLLLCCSCIAIWSLTDNIF